MVDRQQRGHWQRGASASLPRILLAVGALGAAALLTSPYVSEQLSTHPAEMQASQDASSSRLSKLSLISAPLDFATQRMNKALEGSGVPARGRTQGLDRYEINVAGNNALPSSCAFGGPPCARYVGVLARCYMRVKAAASGKL